ncbi:MAG TPA: hypothetical protein VLR10_01615 [Nitrososphaeraceae archaeon]|nr:hypothetical protein [Nitrososphaeraceae archaeon]
MSKSHETNFVAPEESGPSTPEDWYRLVQGLQGQIEDLKRQLEQTKKQKQRSTNSVASSSSQQTIKTPITTVTQVIKNDLSIAKPDIFEGKHNGTLISSWLFQLKLYFEAKDIKDPRRIPFAALYLCGPTLTWWQHYTAAVEMNAEDAIETWEDFTVTITHQFQPFNAIKSARERLSHLRQTKSVTSYAHEF